MDIFVASMDRIFWNLEWGCVCTFAVYILAVSLADALTRGDYGK